MAAGDVTFYNEVKTKLQFLEWGALTYVITLHTGYTPNIDTDTWAGISATEYSTGGGYTASTKTLSGQTVTQDNTNNRGLYDCDNVTWAALLLSPATPSHAVIREQSGNQLICYIELGVATNGADYTLAISNSPAALFVVP